VLEFRSEVQLWDNERLGGMSLRAFFTLFFCFLVLVLGDSVLMPILVINLGHYPPNSPALIPTTMVLSHLSHPQPSTSTSSSPSSHPQKGRSKQNSRLGEPSAWMRGRDEGVMWVFFF